ncbi:MAG: type III-B CRISPR module-associated protein Cmr5 [Promethearchaeota archaeon]
MTTTIDKKNTKKVKNKQQERAAKAMDRIVARGKLKEDDRYVSFAKSFPALLHSSGLVQSVAFAMDKGEQEYLNDLAHVMGVENAVTLCNLSRKYDAAKYMHFSREALKSAEWLKRFAEAASI